MSYYTAPDGMIIIYPEFSDRALLNVFPSTFVRKLIAANPYLPCRLLTCDNVMYVFQGLVTYRSLKESLFSDVRAQQAGLIDRWRASADWKFLRQLLDDDDSYAQTHFPHSRSSDAPLYFRFGVSDFSIPAMTPNLFSCDGLNAKQFIEALKSCNHSREEELSTQAVIKAVEEFAVQRFPNAAPRLREEFVEQMKSPRGNNALVDHQTWLKSEREKSHRYDTSRQGMQDNSHMSSTRLVRTRSSKSISSRANISNDFPGERPLAGGYGRDIATMSIPEIRCIDAKQKERLTSQGRSLHVSLEPKGKGLEVLKPTHIHLLNTTKDCKRKVEIITFYNRSIAVECENLRHRDIAARHLTGTKFSLDEQVFIPSVDRLRQHPDTFNTKWSLYCSDKDHPYVIHEALRRFFCNVGYIPVDDIITVEHAGLKKTMVRVRNATSPVWIRHLASGSHILADCTFEAMPASACAICTTFRHAQHEGRQAQDSAVYNHCPPKRIAGPLSACKAEPKPIPHHGDSNPLDKEGIGSRSPPFTKTLEQQSFAHATSNEATKHASKLDTRLKLASWKIPVSHGSSLEQVTVAKFVDDFVKINGNEAFRTASAADLVKAFNMFLNTHFPGTDYQAKSKTLHRLDPNAPLGAFNTLYQELLDFEHLLNEPAPKPEGKPVKRKMDETTLDGDATIPQKLQKIDPNGLTVQERAEDDQAVDTFLSSLEQHLHDTPAHPDTNDTKRIE